MDALFGIRLHRGHASGAPDGVLAMHSRPRESRPLPVSESGRCGNQSRTPAAASRNAPLGETLATPTRETPPGPPRSAFASMAA